MENLSPSPAAPASVHCDLSVVVPMYNEEGRVLRALDDILSYLSKIPETWEVILVDDGSRDSTVRIIAPLLAKEQRLRLVRLPSNQGKGAAIREGVLSARGRHVLFRDADLSVAMSQFDRFRRVLHEGAGVAIGSRRVPGAKFIHHQPPLREMLGRIFTWLCRALLVFSIRDYTCGFKCFSADAAKAIFPRQRVGRWAFDAEILFLADKLGYKIVQIPIVWEDSPGTKVRLWLDGVRSFLEVIQILAYYVSGSYRLK